MGDIPITITDQATSGLIADSNSYSVSRCNNFYFIPFVDSLTDVGEKKTLDNLLPIEIAVICGDTSYFNGTDGIRAIYPGRGSSFGENVNLIYPQITLTPEHIECINAKREERGPNALLTVDELKLLCTYTLECKSFTTSSYLKTTTFPQEGWHKYTSDPTKGTYISQSHWEWNVAGGPLYHVLVPLTVQERSLMGKTKFVPGVTLHTGLKR